MAKISISETRKLRVSPIEILRRGNMRVSPAIETLRRADSASLRIADSPPDCKKPHQCIFAKSNSAAMHLPDCTDALLARLCRLKASLPSKSASAL